MGKTGRKRPERSEEFYQQQPPAEAEGSGEWLSDKTLKCVDCKDDFPFTGSEQRFFQSKGFTPPKRCKPCRDKRKAQRPPQEAPVKG